MTGYWRGDLRKAARENGSAAPDAASAAMPAEAEGAVPDAADIGNAAPF